MSRENILVSGTDIVEKCESSGEYLFNNRKLEVDDELHLKDEQNKKIAEILNNFVGKQFENTVVLTGAGSSIVNNDSEDLSGYSGKTVWELTESINSYLENKSSRDDQILRLESFSEIVRYFDKTEEYCLDEVNIEDMLSKASVAKEFILSEDEERKKFEKTLEEIESKIQELCDLQLHELHPHKQFLEKITSRRTSHNRVKLFTTNYDTLFEQAAEKNGFILIDGFTYNFPRLFNPFMFNYDFVRRGTNKIIDEPDYVEKVLHLYKLHGSVDWQKKNDNEIVKKKDPRNPLMIYPRKDKYEQSYEAPYFEMFSRFQEELRKKNTLFITTGFSFADKHIQTIVDNAITNNPGLRVLVVDFNIEQENFEFISKKIEDGQQNIMLFQADFATFTELYLKQQAYSDSFFANVGENNE